MSYAIWQLHNGRVMLYRSGYCLDQARITVETLNQSYRNGSVFFYSEAVRDNDGYLIVPSIPA